MTIDLGDGRSVTVDNFQGSVWLTVRARNAGITVAMTAQQGKSVGSEIFNAARIEARKRQDTK